MGVSMTLAGFLAAPVPRRHGGLIMTGAGTEDVPHTCTKLVTR